MRSIVLKIAKFAVKDVEAACYRELLIVGERWGWNGLDWGFGRGELGRVFLSEGGGGGFVGEFLFVEVADDSGDVGFSFVVGRDAVVPVDALRPGVVGGEGFDEIKVVALEEFAQVTGASFDVGLRVEGVADAELGSGLGHELH